MSVIVTQSCKTSRSYYIIKMTSVMQSANRRSINTLGHIISANCDDKSDIISRRNTLCGQINNVLCYFGKCQSLVRQKLMFAYCYSLYGSVLWDLNSHHIESLLPLGARDCGGL